MLVRTYRDDTQAKQTYRRAQGSDEWAAWDAIRSLRCLPRQAYGRGVTGFRFPDGSQIYLLPNGTVDLCIPR